MTSHVHGKKCIFPVLYQLQKKGLHSYMKIWKKKCNKTWYPYEQRHMYFCVISCVNSKKTIQSHEMTVRYMILLFLEGNRRRGNGRLFWLDEMCYKLPKLLVLAGMMAVWLSQGEEDLQREWGYGDSMVDEAGGNFPDSTRFMCFIYNEIGIE